MTGKQPGKQPRAIRQMTPGHKEKNALMTPRPVPERIALTPEPLTQAAFRPFGDVLSKETCEKKMHINEGTTWRFHKLAQLDVSAHDGTPIVSWFTSTPRRFPFFLRCLEKHPLGSQAFFPLAPHPEALWYIVVAPPGAEPDLGQIRAFVATGRQGIQYHRGVWHHPLLATSEQTEFLVLDRAGPGLNLVEKSVTEAQIVLQPGPKPDSSPDA